MEVSSFIVLCNKGYSFDRKGAKEKVSHDLYLREH